MTATLLLRIITGAGFDPGWFAVILTTVMVLGMSTYLPDSTSKLLRALTLNAELNKILCGAVPFVITKISGIILQCLFPGIATWLPA